MRQERASPSTEGEARPEVLRVVANAEATSSLLAATKAGPAATARFHSGLAGSFSWGPSTGAETAVAASSFFRRTPWGTQAPQQSTKCPMTAATHSPDAPLPQQPCSSNNSSGSSSSIASGWSFLWGTVWAQGLAHLPQPPQRLLAHRQHTSHLEGPGAPERVELRLCGISQPPKQLVAHDAPSFAFGDKPRNGYYIEKRDQFPLDRLLRSGQAQELGTPSHEPAVPVELTLRDRAFAAGAAAVLSAVIMNPLDVAKTRLQAQAAGYTYSQASANAPCTSCGSPWPDPVTRRHLSSYQLEWLWGGTWEPRIFRGSLQAGGPPAPVMTAAAKSAESCAVACDFPLPSNKTYRGALDVFLRIAREEGPLRLWRGTGASLLMAVPSVGIYMPVYDSLRSTLEGGTLPPLSPAPWTAPYAPFIAGAASRFLATTLCAPLELARTRIQAANQTMAPAHRAATSGGYTVSFVTHQRGILQTLQQAVAAEDRRRGNKSLGNYRVLWRGLDAHLARDVPFSAICWSTLEPLRRFLLHFGSSKKISQLPTTGELGTQQQGSHANFHPEHHASLARILAANFAAGVIAGSSAAAITTPLDVVKTRVQIEICADTAGRGFVYHLVKIGREGGWKALFTGVGPRALRAGPSVGIIVSFYEMLKALLSHSWR